MENQSQAMIEIIQKERKYFLFKVADILDKNNIEFFLSFGTLLGAIREQNFIEYDNDIDIGFRKNYFSDNSKLWKKIIRELNEYKITPNVVWDNHSSTSFLYNFNSSNYTDKISMDMYYHQKKDNKYYVNLQGIQYFFKEDFIDTLEKITFLNRDFNIPSTPKKYLAFMYGNNWTKQLKKKASKNLIKRPETIEIHYKHMMPYYKGSE